MELTHDFTVPASIDAAWAIFMDLEGVGGCFPGATVTSATEDGFTGTVKVKLGPIALVYAGAGQFLSRDDAAYRAVIEAKGKDKRGNGTAGATVTIQLAPSGEGTRIDVVTDLAVTGKPAQFGRGVMQDVSDKLLQQFVTCIEGRFAGLDVEGSAAPGAPAFAPAEGGGGTVTTGTAEDGLRPWTPPRPSADTVVADRGAPSVEGAEADSARPAAPAPASPAPAAPAPASPAPAASVDSIDLGATVLPVVLRSYAPHAVVALLGLLIGYLLGRRR